VPVQLVTAVRDQDLHFRQLHEKDKSPIDVQRWCSEEDKEVPYEEIDLAEQEEPEHGDDLTAALQASLGGKS